MINHTKTLKFDPQKRHLIVGDIHGYYSTLKRLLEKVNYDPTKDVVYTVGDMIDRGPYSYEVLDFFNQPNCHAIRGNHEHMAITPSWSDVWLDNGGTSCIRSITENGIDDYHQWLRDYVNNLPWIINVDDEEGHNSFRIAHAEIPLEWSDSYVKQTLDQALNGDDSTFARIIWSRNVISTYTQLYTLEDDGATVLNMLRSKMHSDRKYQTFVGHSILRKVTNVCDLWYLDTGNSGLSMIDVVTKEVYTCVKEF